LLGKTSLDWLYGLKGALPEAVQRFGDTDSAGNAGCGDAE